MLQMKAAQVKLYKQKLSSADPHILSIGEVMLSHFMLNYSPNIPHYSPNIPHYFPWNNSGMLSNFKMPKIKLA